MRMNYQQFKKAISISGINLVFDSKGRPFIGTSYSGVIPVPLAFESLAYIVKYFPTDAVELEKKMAKDEIVIKRLYDEYLRKKESVNGYY